MDIYEFLGLPSLSPMNRRQLEKLGVPSFAVAQAIIDIQLAAKKGGMKGRQIKAAILRVCDNPEACVDDPYFSEFAKTLVKGVEEPEYSTVGYQTWGKEIEVSAHAQMEQACRIPYARGGALMPDAHLGYGLPIGGVLATEGVVIPYAVGVDIACRMKLSILDLPVESLREKDDQFKDALNRGTRFGMGCVHEKPQSHAVMDEDWSISGVTNRHKDKAWKQLGTSGSGNHFVEFGVVTVDERDDTFGLEPGKYVGLLSHSGSRGVGASVCKYYSDIARERLPELYEEFKFLAWLELNSEVGAEYWEAMNLMGRYASGNHEVIHRLVSELMGAEVIGGVENHHNFAWKEQHGGKDVIVHRKGATPAGEGVLGVIPGSMAAPAFVVKGLGKAESLNSASHGAGRCMSRTKAKDRFNFKREQRAIGEKGVQILSAGADEVPQVYKDIHSVMAAQKDLVRPIAKFDPKIVKMCGDGSRAED